MKYYIKIALQHLAMGLIIPISVIWKLESGLTLPQALFTESLVLLATAIADLPAGFIANKINNKRSLVIGAVLHVIAVALLIVGGSFMIFALSAVVMGVAWAFVSGADEAYIHDDYIADKKQYRHVFATATIVDEAATIVGMGISSLMVYLGGGLRSVFCSMSSTVNLACRAYLGYIAKESHSSQVFDDKNVYSLDLTKQGRGANRPYYYRVCGIV